MREGVGSVFRWFSHHPLAFNPLPVSYALAYHPIGRSLRAGNIDASALHTHNLVRLLKCQPARHRICFNLEGLTFRLNPTDYAAASFVIARAMSLQVAELVAGRVCIVPVPSSWKTLAAHRQSVPEQLAERLTPYLTTGSTIWTGLRFAAERTPTHGGGNRSFESILACLVAESPVPKRRIILVDDVMTSGAHLRAAATFLMRLGGRVAGASVAVLATRDRTRIKDGAGTTTLGYYSPMPAVPDPMWDDGP